MKEFTKEEIKEMSPEEIKLWYQIAAEEQAVAKMRQQLLDIADVQEAEENNTIKLHGN